MLQIKAIWAVLVLATTTACLGDEPTSQPTSQPATKRVRVMGTGVSLGPPPGFRQARHFQGLLSADGATLIVVSELETTYRDLRATWCDDEQLANSNVSVAARRRARLDGRPGLICEGRREVDGVQRPMISVIINGDQPRRCLLVQAILPRDCDDALKRSVSDSILNGLWDEEFKPEPDERLGFEVEPAGDFRQSMTMSTARLFSIGGKHPINIEVDPCFIASVFYNPQQARNLKAENKRFATELRQYREARDVEQRPVVVDGMKGYELLMTAKANDSDVDVRAYVLSVTGGDGDIFNMIASTPLDVWEHYEADIRATARSLRRHWNDQPRKTETVKPSQDTD